LTLRILDLWDPLEPPPNMLVPPRFWLTVDGPGPNGLIGSNEASSTTFPFLSTDEFDVTDMASNKY